MASIGTNYDPASTAQALAEAFTASRQQILTSQRQTASATEKALGTLGSALSAFQSSLTSLTGLNKTMAASSAIFSNTAVASATASATAAAGTYSFFVEQLASAHQVSYSDVKDVTGTAGSTLKFESMVGEPPSAVERFSVTLKPGTYTVREMAAAINNDAKNTAVLASVVTATRPDGTTFSELVLTSKLTGQANNIKMTASGDAKVALGTNLAKESVPAQDAIVRIGASGGTATYSQTNTFNLIDGVSMTVTQAQAPGSAPVMLTVGTDASKTGANVQAFVDAYNKLKSAVDGLSSPGDPAGGTAAGAFSGDSGVRALRDRLVSLVRESSGTSLATFGIIANRQGTLSVDSARLSKALASDPTGLDKLIGNASSTAPSGIAGKLDTYLKVWTDSTKGQIGSRKTAVSKLQVSLTDRQTTLDRQYDSAYARYLAQFTQLQAVQNSMSHNSSLFDALFSSDKD